MTRNHRLAWLFDVDGTLITTGGASRGAFAAAVHHLLGVEDNLGDIAFAGRTEPLILRDILAKHDRILPEGDEARFWNQVFDRMGHALASSPGHVLPGVRELLDRVAAEPGWVSGLLTGNMTQMARIKLKHYGLEGRFEFGAFGEQAADRDALACDAVARVQRDYGVPAHRCVIVGDTEHDVACARAAGARVVAVATGWKPREELERLGPDLMLDDLTDADTLIEWARGIATER